MRAALAAAALIALALPARSDPLSVTVTSAVAGRELSGAAAMTIVLSPESTAAFGALTAANVGSSIDLRIDGQTVLTAVIRDPILGGELRISGGLSFAALSALAARIQAGTATVEAEVRQP